MFRTSIVLKGGWSAVLEKGQCTHRYVQKIKGKWGQCWLEWRDLRWMRQKNIGSEVPERTLFWGWIRVSNAVLAVGQSSLFVLFHWANISVTSLVIQFVYQDSAEEFSCFGGGCNVVCWSYPLAFMTFPAVEGTYEFTHLGLSISTSLPWPHLQRCCSHPASSFPSCLLLHGSWVTRDLAGNQYDMPAQYSAAAVENCVYGPNLKLPGSELPSSACKANLLCLFSLKVAFKN
jgi:hypothetical protein